MSLLTYLIGCGDADSWPTLHPSMFTPTYPFGRKPSGAAAAKRASRRRRNIAKRMPK